MWERFHLGSPGLGPPHIVSDHQGQARGRHGDDACQDEGVTVRKNSKKWVAVAGIASISLLASACGGNDTETPATPGAGGGTSGGATKDITLTVATFNNWGYTDELLKEYMDANPGIKVVHTKAAESKDARANLTTRIAAGGDGLADIEGIEIDWMPELSPVEDAFADLTDAAVDGRWLEWKLNQGKTPSGKLIGYGSDIGPEAVCYRSDLFKEAGLPTDREEVAKLLEGDWAHYFEVGKQFVAKSDSAWYDDSNAILQGMIGQVEAPYEDPATGAPTDLASNTTVKGLYDQILAVAPDLSAHLKQWQGDWDTAFQKDGFATMLCPAWMTGPIEERSGGVEGWDVADVFPGGGGNWGGSFLTVPASGKNVDEAKKLAQWLTSPEVQIKAFNAAGTFPSQIEAQSSQDLLDAKNEFFNNAPVGAIFSARAKAIDGIPQPFKGKNYFAIHQTVQDAIERVDVNQNTDAAASWDKALSDFKALGL